MKLADFHYDLGKERDQDMRVTLMQSVKKLGVAIQNIVDIENAGKVENVEKEKEKEKEDSPAVKINKIIRKGINYRYPLRPDELGVLLKERENMPVNIRTLIDDVEKNNNKHDRTISCMMAIQIYPYSTKTSQNPEQSELEEKLTNLLRVWVNEATNQTQLTSEQITHVQTIQDGLYSSSAEPPDAVNNKIKKATEAFKNLTDTLAPTVREKLTM